MKIPKPRQLSSGKWHIQLRLDGRSVSISEWDKATCVAKAAAIKAERREDHRHGGTLRTAIDRYIDAREHVLSPSTLRGYRSIQRVRLQSIMDKPLDTLTQTQLQSAVNLESAQCSAKTVTNAWRFVASVLAAEAGKRFDLRLPQIIRNEQPFLQPEELRPFIAAVSGTDVEVPALLALHSLRRSELLALRWCDVDLAAKTITVNGAVVRDQHSVMVRKQQTKNQTSRRTIPIMIPALYDALAKQNPRPSADLPVVTMKDDHILTCIKRACAAAEVTVVSIHGLRHSFASLCYHLNVPEKISMQIGGWANDQTMRRIYTHVAKSDLQKHTTALQDFFRTD